MLHWADLPNLRLLFWYLGQLLINWTLGLEMLSPKTLHPGLYGLDPKPRIKDPSVLPVPRLVSGNASIDTNTSSWLYFLCVDRMSSR